MQITENPEEIIIRYVPVRALALSGALAFITGVWLLWLLYSSLAGESISSKFASGSWTDFISIAFVGVVFLVLLLSFIKTPIVTVTVSRRGQSVDAHFGRILGGRTDRYYFTQIRNFRAYQDNIDSSRYYLGLILENKQEVRLKALIGKDKEERTKIVKKCNKFIAPPKPSQKPSPNNRQAQTSETSE